MSYRVSWSLHGQYRETVGSRAQVAALSEYLRKTFRIEAQVSAA